MKLGLSIITPCSRPENLPRMEFPIERGAGLVEITWYIIYDSHLIPEAKRTYKPKPNVHFKCIIGATEDPMSAVGNAQNNYALEQVPPDDWTYFLSDDNVPHPAFWSGLVKAIETYPQVNVFIFPQQMPGEGIRPTGPSMVHVEQIDLAQFVIKRSLIGDTRFNLPRYQSDGQLIEEVYAKPESCVAFLPKAMSFYNRLRW